MKKTVKNVLRNEDGSATVANIFWFTVAAMLAGGALDTTNIWRVQHQLQIAADASALAAAANIADETEARRVALDLATVNLSGFGPSVMESDVEFGAYSAADDLFEPGVTPYNAVRVTANRLEARGNQIPSYLLRLAGLDRFDARASAMAITAGESIGCDNATILTSNTLQTGGGNTWNDGVCLHGEMGAYTGGNDYYGAGVYVSAANASNIGISTVASGSRPAEEVALERSLTPTIVPNLTSMFTAHMNEVTGRDGQVYTGGALPEFMVGAEIVELSSHWVVFKPEGSLQPWETTNPGIVEIEENKIYVAPGGVTFEGNVDIDNVTILASQIQIGGGADLEFTNVYFFGRQSVNASGSVAWGDPDTYCDEGNYNAYLFAGNRLSLGGNASLYGVVAAAPAVSPGGALSSAGGLYMEATSYLTTGGHADVTGCGFALESEVTITSGSTEDGSGATRLVY